MATKKAIKDKYSTTVQELVKRKKEGFESERSEDTTKVKSLVLTKKIPVLKDTISYEDIVGEPHPDGIERLYPKPFTGWSSKDSIPVRDPDYIPDHRVLPMIIAGMSYKKNVLMVGDTGAGKTKDVLQVSAWLGLPYCRINGFEGGEACDIIGGIHIIKGETKWVDGPILDVVRNGGLLTIDEWSNYPAGTLAVLQWLCEVGKERAIMLYGHPEPSQIKVIAHPEFRLVLCSNVRGTGDKMDKYTATQIQDSSFINRMQYKIIKEYMSSETETLAICSLYPWITEELAHKMVQLGTLMRKAWNNGAIELAFSFRELQTWSEIIGENQGEILSSLYLAYGNLLTVSEERDILVNAIRDVKF